MSAPRLPAVPGNAPRPVHSIKSASLAAAIAIIVQSGFRNLLWACAIFGAPVATVGFVYQVVVMHQDRFRHEFVANAAEALSRDVGEPDLIDVKVTAPSLVDARPNYDLRQALFATLIARARFVDVHGVDHQAMSPAARKAAQGFLVDDSDLFRRLDNEKQKDRDTYLFDWRSYEGRLHVLHAELDALVSRTATASTTPPPDPSSQR